MDDSKDKLREMETYPCVLSDIINALKKKGVRFDEVCFDNGDIRYLDNNIVVFRGNAAKLLNRTLHGVPSGIPGEKIRHCNLRLGSRPHAPIGIALRLINCVGASYHALHPFKWIWCCHKIKNRSLPRQYGSS